MWNVLVKKRQKNCEFVKVVKRSGIHLDPAAARPRPDTDPDPRLHRQLGSSTTHQGRWVSLWLLKCYFNAAQALYFPYYELHLLESCPPSKAPPPPPPERHSFSPQNAFFFTRSTFNAAAALHTTTEPAGNPTPPPFLPLLPSNSHNIFHKKHREIETGSRYSLIVCFFPIVKFH